MPVCLCTDSKAVVEELRETLFHVRKVVKMINLPWIKESYIRCQFAFLFLCSPFDVLLHWKWSMIISMQGKKSCDLFLGGGWKNTLFFSVEEFVTFPLKLLSHQHPLLNHLQSSHSWVAKHSWVEYRTQLQNCNSVPQWIRCRKSFPQQLVTLISCSKLYC